MTIFAKILYLKKMEMTAKALAALTGGVVEGDGETVIRGFAKIEEARPGDISFIANQKYEHFIHTTKASVVLVRSEFNPGAPVEPTLVRVSDPYKTVADLLNMLQRGKALPEGIEQPCHIAEGTVVPEGAYIGAFAYIGKEVILGKGVKIYPQTYIGDGCRIGEGTIVRAGVKIYKGCEIGRNCIIHSGAVIGADGFGFAPTPDGSYEKIPQIGNVRIADDVEIGANTCIDRATFGSTVIGEGTKLDNLIQIAHNVDVGRCNVFASQTGIAGSAKVGDYNQMGGQTGVAGHISIGSFNQIGAQSGIPNSVGDHKRIIGYPAIDARQFAKNLVYIKRLPELFDRKSQNKKQ